MDSDKALRQVGQSRWSYDKFYFLHVRYLDGGSMKWDIYNDADQQVTSLDIDEFPNIKSVRNYIEEFLCGAIE